MPKIDASNAVTATDTVPKKRAFSTTLGIKSISHIVTTRELGTFIAKLTIIKRITINAITATPNSKTKIAILTVRSAKKQITVLTITSRIDVIAVFKRSVIH